MAAGTWAGILLVVLVGAPLAWVAWKRPLMRKTARRSARGHLKQGLAVSLTAAVATAVIAGALVVGDSMEALVETTATEALPGIDGTIRTVQPVETGYFTKLFFQPEWKRNVAKTSMVLTVPAATTCDVTGRRDGRVTLMGFTDSLYGLSSFYKDGDQRTAPLTGEVAINQHLADQLGAQQGDSVTLRVPNPGFWGDFLFLFGEDAAVERTYRVRFVFDDAGLGRLDLDAKRTPSSTVFMDLADIQELLGVEGKVNAVLFQYKDGDIVGTDRERRLLRASIRQLDGLVGSEGVDLVIQHSPGGWDTLTSDRIFLPGELMARLSKATEAWSATLTYFVDSIEEPGGEDLAYSTVSGINFPADLDAFGDWQWTTGSTRATPRPGSYEALVNNWTADALGVGPGDTITVGYTIVDDRYQLVKRSVDLTVVGVVDIAGKAADPSLLPPIPGVHDQSSCLDWEPPFPMDLQTLEPEDVEYWNLWKGTPKVWIDSGTARALWSNPDGDWTSARFIPLGGEGNATLSHFDDAVTAGDAGIAVVAARAEALDTAGPLEIFEQMFLAFGAVLLLAGVFLLASAFDNLARARLREHATLRALGMDRWTLVQVMLLEGVVWGGVAALFGVAAGAGLGASLVGALNTVWADAVEGATIPLSIEGASLWLALGLGLVVTMATLFMAARRAVRADLAPSLADRSGTAVEAGIPIPPERVLLLTFLLLIVPASAGAAVRPDTNTGGLALFFTVGTLATLGSVLGALIVLDMLETRLSFGGLIAPWRLGLRSLNRRPKRAITLVATFAVVSFAVVGISWAGEVELRHAGQLQGEQTGGYDVVAETYVPVRGDLATLPDAPDGDWTVTPVKVVGQQGGSCSNLNARFPPRVMGMPDSFLENVTIAFRSSSVGGDRATWRSLDSITDEGHVPVVVDYNTLVWIYGGELGQVYSVDGDNGWVYGVQVVGVMENSIFGGSFVTSVDMVDRIFPDSAGYTYFLFDSGSQSPERLARDLEASFGDLGLDARPAEDVVRENLAYELSFIRLFQAYLALGLVVGALGLGALAMREVRDRRQEIGAMRALGWDRRSVLLIFLAEQVWFALAGVLAGIVGATLAIVATSPGWLGSIGDIYFPAGTVGAIALAVVGAAALGGLIAARDASRVDPSEAMRCAE